jgi:hypothetical protein
MRPTTIRYLVLVIAALSILVFVVQRQFTPVTRAATPARCWHHTEQFMNGRVSICIWPHLHQVHGQAYAFTGTLSIRNGETTTQFPGNPNFAPKVFTVTSENVHLDGNHPPSADAGYYALFTPGNEEFDLGLSCDPSCAASKSWALGKWPHLYLMYPGQ